MSVFFFVCYLYDSGGVMLYSYSKIHQIVITCCIRQPDTSHCIQQFPDVHHALVNRCVVQTSAV